MLKYECDTKQKNHLGGCFEMKKNNARPKLKLEFGTKKTGIGALNLKTSKKGVLNLKTSKKKDAKNSKNAEKALECYNKIMGTPTKNNTDDTYDIDTNNLSKMLNKMKREDRLKRQSNTSYTNTNSEDENWFLNTFLVRAKEILILSSFIVGITFTALIATGILSWGMLALGIFEAIGFLGASHLFGSSSLTDQYYKNGIYGEGRGNCLLYDKDDKDENNTLGKVSDVLVFFKFIVFPLIFLSGGIALIILGNVGMIGFPLSLILGIPSIFAALSALNFWTKKKGDREDEKIRSGWRKFVIVTGILAVATFFVLSFTGVFALPVAIGFTLPIIGFDLWCFAMKCIECCIRNSGEIEEENLESPITEQNRYPKNKNVAYGQIPTTSYKTEVEQ